MSSTEERRKVKAGDKSSSGSTDGSTDQSGTAVKAAGAFQLQGAKVLDIQVGGHRYGSNGKKIGMLDRGNGIVLKALQAPPRGTRELTFYQDVFSQDCKDKDLLQLRPFLPCYGGTETDDGVTLLVMQNLAHHFPKPNILDLKMGLVTYDPEASAEKREHENAKYPPREQLGFQFTGMMTHNPTTGTGEHFKKPYCRSITADTMLRDGLGKFFGLDRGNLRKDVVKALLGKLQRIEAWFDAQRKLAFYASSLLIVYSSEEGSPDSTECARTATNTSQSNFDKKIVLPNSEKAGISNPDSEPGNSAACVTADLPPLSADSSTSTTNSNVCPADSGLEREGEGSSGKRNAQDSDTLSNSIAHPGVKREMSPDPGGSAETVRSSKQLKTSREAAAAAAAKLRNSSEETALSVTSCPDETAGQTSDAQSEESVGVGTGKGDPAVVEVRMIDFAHVFPSSERDDNYLFGLRKLISLLKQLLEL